MEQLPASNLTDLELSLWVGGGDGHDVTDQFFVLH